MVAMGETAKAEGLFQQAQDALDDAKIQKNAKELSEETMSSMVRMWSR